MFLEKRRKSGIIDTLNDSCISVSEGRVPFLETQTEIPGLCFPRNKLSASRPNPISAHFFVPDSNFLQDDCYILIFRITGFTEPQSSS